MSGDVSVNQANRDVTLAMAVRGSRPYWHLHGIAVRHWRALAELSGLPHAFTAMQQLVANADTALTRLEGRLPADFPPHVWERIAAGVRTQVARFQLGVEASA
jgi:serine/threonine-protein kinase HipA